MGCAMYEKESAIVLNALGSASIKVCDFRAIGKLGDVIFDSHVSCYLGSAYERCSRRERV